MDINEKDLLKRYNRFKGTMGGLGGENDIDFETFKQMVENLDSMEENEPEESSMDFSDELLDSLLGNVEGDEYELYHKLDNLGCDSEKVISEVEKMKLEHEEEMEFLNARIKKEKNKKKYKVIKKATSSAVIALAVITMFTSVPVHSLMRGIKNTIETAVVQLISGEKAIKINFNNSVSEETDIKHPTYIPEGYELVKETDYDDGSYEYLYINQNGNVIFIRMHEKKKVSYYIDEKYLDETYSNSEYKVYDQRDINKNHVIKEEGNYVYIISGNETKEELIKIMEGIE